MTSISAAPTARPTLVCHRPSAPNPSAACGGPADHVEAADVDKIATAIGGAPALGVTSTCRADIVSSSLANTAADYRVGSPRPPVIEHDNGFLQNPKDPHDPVPRATVTPEVADYVSLAIWRSKLEGAEVLRPDLPDATAAYHHFLDGEGVDRRVDLERYVANDPSGKDALANGIRDLQSGAQQAYLQLTKAEPSLAGRPIRFHITSGEIRAGDVDAKYRDQFRYPDTENWQKALGGHSMWLGGDVTVYPPSAEAGATFTVRMTMNVEDRYNFNPGQRDIASGAPDSENGRFEQTGLAHQYTNRGSLARDLVWQGDPSEVPTKARATRANEARHRRPQENRRAHNRI